MKATAKCSTSTIAVFNECAFLFQCDNSLISEYFEIVADFIAIVKSNHLLNSTFTSGLTSKLCHP